ncbi:MAG: thioesterase family protein [Gemmatimonadota bacterium]
MGVQGFAASLGSHAPDAAGHVTHVRVRYAESDQMGVVYHTHYLVWCEVGRTDLLRALGRSYSALERDGLRLAVVDAKVRYVAPARYDDLVRVETRVGRVRSRMITFDYELSSAEPPIGLLARASTTLVALDSEGQPRTLPGELRDALARLAEGVDALDEGFAGRQAGQQGRS